MPLSEHEQQQLDELEKQLYREDPRFVQHISAPRELTGASLNAKSFVLGVLVLVVGIVVAAGGLVLLSDHQPWNIVVGVVGFAIMVFGGYVAVSGNKRRGPADAAAPGAGKDDAASKSSKSAGGFMGRMEERWERRQDN